jgi:hypothetical protein
VSGGNAWAANRTAGPVSAIRFRRNAVGSVRRQVIAASLDAQDNVLAASTVIPGDGESHRALNRLHVFAPPAGRLLAEWTGWEVTGLAALDDGVVCTSVKRHIYRCRSGRVDSVEHPEPDRCLHCCARTPAGVFMGGTTGYFLIARTLDLDAEAHNLSEFEVPKPGRDILAVEVVDGGLLLCGSGRLVVRIKGTAAESLLPIGREPRAAPRFHAVAVLDNGDVMLASSGELWRLASQRVERLEVEEEVHATAGVVFAVEERLLVGGEAVYSVPHVGAPSQIYGASEADVWVVGFVHPQGRPPLSIWSNGDVVELATPARRIGNILGGETQAQP